VNNAKSVANTARETAAFSVLGNRQMEDYLS